MTCLTQSKVGQIMLHILDGTIYSITWVGMSEKHLTRLLSKYLSSRLITCLTQSRVTQMLLIF